MIEVQQKYLDLYIKAVDNGLIGIDEIPEPYKNEVKKTI